MYKVATGKISEASAVHAFMGWLTSRDEVSGPFSSHHDAIQAAQLIEEFFKAQGWVINDTQYAEPILAPKPMHPR